MGGIEAIPRLLEASPERAACWSSPPTTPTSASWRRVRAGATGYLLKGARRRGDRPRHPRRRGRRLGAGAAAWRPRWWPRCAAPRGAGPLTAREREVLRLIAAGLPSKQIARALGISERTVKFHATSLLRKLGADNRAQAVALAAQRGLLDAPRRD